jgi:hypothetical protein
MDAHNFYILLAAEAGVVAPVFLLLLLASLLLLGRRLALMTDDEEALALGVGFMMATIAVAMGNLYGSRFVDGDVMGNYWIVAALVARAIMIKESERLERLQPLHGGQTGASRRGGGPARRALSTIGASRGSRVGQAAPDDLSHDRRTAS